MTIDLHQHNDSQGIVRLGFRTGHLLRTWTTAINEDITLSPLSSSRFSSEADLCELRASPAVYRQFGQSPRTPRLAIARKQIARLRSKPLRGEQLTREAVLLTFCDPLPQRCSRLQHLSSREWQHLLRWLDLSGLALYFLDRLIELQLGHWLPPSILGRLQRNLIDNAERTRSMIAESIAIQKEFQEACLSYAKLKGLSLWPSSIAKPELRSQFDLDFLVAEESAPEARRILEQRGYRLYAVSGRSWEFKLNERPGITLKDLYKAQPSHAVELHIDSRVPGHPSVMDRIERRELCGLSMPVLSPVDLFIGQGMHAYKHVCSEFSRTAHLLEFRRHVLTRRDDDAFWIQVQAAAGEDPRASLALGVITLLITYLMGDFAPDGLTSWTVERLPQPIQMWVNMYGYRVAFGNFPGSKMYLILQRELEVAGFAARRSLRDTLFPSRWPPPVIRAFPNETLSVRLGRYRMQIRFILLRLRFHVVEGVRYGWEIHRWHRFVNRLAR